MFGQTQLLQIVAALRAASRFAGGLHRRQQQRNQHGDDRNHHQQFNERKSPTRGPYKFPFIEMSVRTKKEYPRETNSVSGDATGIQRIAVPAFVPSRCAGCVLISVARPHSDKVCDGYRNRQESGKNLAILWKSKPAKCKVGVAVTARSRKTAPPSAGDASLLSRDSSVALRQRGAVSRQSCAASA